MKCKACGTELPEDALYCTQCGVHLETGARANGDSPDSAVFPLLAAANLARMRGQWDTAEQRCLEVLRHYPDNATAHSLLGDIYARQGRWADSAQWYERAVALDPDNQADRAKLEQVRRHLAGDGATASSGPPLPTGTLPTRRPHSPLLQLAVVAGLAFAVMAGIHAIWQPSRKEAPAPLPPPPVEAPEPPATRHPPASTGAPSPGGGAEGSNAPAAATGHPDEASPRQPDEASSGAPEPAAAPEAAPVPGPDMTEWEARALSRLQAELPAVAPTLGGQVSDLRWDPLRERALVTVRLPSGAAAQLRDEALRGAYRVGQGLVRLGVARFAVVVKAPLPPGRAPEILFAGEAENAAAAAWSADAATARPETLMPRFAAIWWHPQLP